MSQTAEEKLSSVDAQLTLIEHNRLDRFTCPYCFLETENGQNFCCVKLGAAVEALVQRKESQEALDQIARIADKIHSQ